MLKINNSYIGLSPLKSSIYKVNIKGGFLAMNLDKLKDKAVDAAKKAQKNEKVREKEKEIGVNLTEKVKGKLGRK